MRVKRVEFKLNTDPKFVKRGVKESIGDPIRESPKLTVWQKTSSYILKSTVELYSDKLIVEKHLPNFTKYITLGLVLLLPFAISSHSPLYILFTVIWAWILYGGKSKNIELPHGVINRDTNITNYCFLTVLLSTIVTWSYARSITPLFPIDVLFLTISVFVVVLMLYVYGNRFSGFNTGLQNTIVTVAFQPLLYLAASYAFATIFFYGFFIFPSSIPDSYKTYDVIVEIVNLLYSIFAFSLILTAIATSIFMFVTYCKDCEKLNRTSLDPSFASFSSKKDKNILATLTLSMNIVSILGFFSIIDVFLYYFYKIRILNGELNLLSLNTVTNGQSTITGFETIYSGISQVQGFLSQLPILPSRAYLFILSVIILWPGIYFYGSWIYKFTETIIAKSRILINAKEIDGLSLPQLQTISVLKVPNKGVDVRPMITLFGLKKYIIISETVSDTLNQEELEAVLMHEYYHLKNRDLELSTMSFLLGSIFGGKNLLISFYEYPEKELKADDYAADQVGKLELAMALQKLNEAAADQSFNTKDLLLGVNEVDEKSKSRIGDVFSLFLQPYKINFGPVIVDLSHLSVQERIERILG